MKIHVYLMENYNLYFDNLHNLIEPLILDIIIAMLHYSQVIFQICIKQLVGDLCESVAHFYTGGDSMDD